MKYLIDEQKGLFSFEFLQKVYHCAFVWKNILFDQLKQKLIFERRKCFRVSDDKGFREAVKKLDELEETCFKSALQRTKKEVQILESNFNTTNNAYMNKKECKEKIDEV